MNNYVEELESKITLLETEIESRHSLNEAYLATLRDRDAHIAELEVEVGRLREALGHIAEYWNRDPNEKAMTDALWEIIDAAEKALSQSAGDRYEKMEAVIGLAKEARNRYVDFTAATEPGSEAWRYKYLDDAMANLRQALADLKGGGGE